MSRRKQAKPRALKRETLHSEDDSTEDTLPLGDNNFVQEIEDSPMPLMEASSVDSDDDDAASSTDMEDGPKYRCGGCRTNFDDLSDFLEHHEDCITRGSNGGGTATPPGSLRSLSGTPDEATLSPSPGSSSCCATPSSSSGGGGTGCDPDSELSFTLGVTESTPYGCQFCDRAFPRLSYLKRHEQVHSDQMPFRCDYCQRLFKHKRSRDRHVKLHTGDRKYRCTQCESAFSRSDHLKIHMKTHDNGKPYQCTVCNRGYNTAAALSSHMQNHKKIPQQELVQTSFDQQQMNSSLEVSTTPLPPASTKCGQCSAEFSNVADLQSHLTHQHCRNISESPEPPKPMVCSFCPQICTSPESLRDHLTQNHQGSCPSPVSSTNNTKYSEEGFSPGILNSYKTERSSPSDNCPNLHDIQQPPRTEGFSPGQQQLTCGFCSRCDFPSFESLQLHVQVLHTSQCNSASSNPMRSLVKQRSPKHLSPTGSAGFNCEFCCQSFSSLTSLQKHTLSTHSFSEILSQQKKSADIYCSQCNIGFTSSNALLDHVHLVHEPNTVTSHPLTLAHSNNKRNLAGSRLRPNGVKHMKSAPILSNPPMSLFNGMSSVFYRRQNVVRSESPISSTVGGHALTPLKALSNTLLCSQCNAAFQDFESFRTHLKNHLDEAAGLGSHTSHRFTCPECDVEFDNDHLLDGHVIGHFLSSTTEYGCQSCLKLFQKPDDLQKHLLDIHAHHLYRCALCKQVFDSKVSIQVHFAVKHSNECRTFKCISCGAYFRNELEFQVHVKVSHLSCSDNSKSCQPFRCLLCDQVCPSEEQLRYHVATHKKLFSCSLCGEAFHVEFLLDRHVQTVHQNTSRLPSSSPVHHPFLSGQSKNANSPNSEVTANSAVSEDVAQNLSVKRNISNFSIKVGDKNNPSVVTPEALQRMSTPSPTSTSGTISGVTTMSATTGPSNLEFRCDVCEMCSFSTEAALNSHRRQAHNVRNSQKSGSGSQPPALSLFCAYCNESCKSRHDLENHMKGHTATPTRHKCNICDEVCPSATTLAEHKLTHCKVVSSSMCIVCRIPLNTEEDFVDHLQQHNNGAKSEHGLPGPCVVCRQTLIAEVEMRMHAKFHARNCNNPEVVTHASCCVCSRKFDIGNLIIRSLAKPSSSDALPHTYMCKECFHSKSDDVPVPAMRCGDCGVKFENDCEMDIHRRKCCGQFNHIRTEDINGKTYQCIKCQTSFESEAEIQAHVTCHVMQEGTDHECKLCQKVLDSPSKLQCHLIEHTFEGCPSFTCYMCSSIFTGSHLLQQHMLEHGLDARPYDCSRCHHKFYFRAELDNHSYIHQMEDHAKNLAKDCFKELRQFCSPTLSLPDVQDVFSDKDTFFPCRKCSAKFTTFSNLQRHTCLVRLKELNPVKKEYEVDNFSGKQAAEPKFEFPISQQSEPLISEKKHGCPMCQKRFTRRENLRLHLKTRHHSEDTPYSCSQCGKSFSRKGLLKEHNRIHGESTTKPCESCNQCFESAQQLKHHQATSHGRRFDHKCPVCGDLFSKTKGLENHLDKAHQVQVQEPEHQHIVSLEKIQSPEPPETQKHPTSDESHKNDSNSNTHVQPIVSESETLDSQAGRSCEDKETDESVA